MHRRQNLPHRRPGYSLLEMMVVIFMLGMLMASGLTVFSTMLGEDRQSLEAATGMLTWSRLDRSFRQDVHAATDCQVESADKDQPTRCVLTLAESRRIEYEAAGQNLTRIEYWNDKPHFRDRYLLPGTETEFAEAGSMVRLVHRWRLVDPSGSEVQGVPREVTIAARLSRNALQNASETQP